MSDVRSPRDSSGACGPSRELWYVESGSEVFGPYSAQIIGKMLQQGSINGKTGLARVGAKHWSDLADEPAFASFLRSPRTSQSPFSRKRPYVSAMLVITCAYLVCELGFNARLLDVVGGLAGPSEIDAIQKWGRAISGIALALAVLGVAVLPAATGTSFFRRHLFPISIAITMACIATAWFAERALVRTMVDSSTGELRRTALYLRIASIAALNGKLPISDINLGDPNVRQPAAKAFLAIFPGFVLSYPEIRAKLDRLVRDPRMRTAVADSTGLVPTAQELWDSLFLPLFAKARGSYDGRYAEGNARYHQALDLIPHRQADLWRKYVEQLRENGLTPQTARDFRSIIVAKLQDQNLNIPQNWDPADKSTFELTVAQQVRAAAAAAFADESKRVLELALPPDLQWQDFCQHIAVQSYLRKALGITENLSLTCAMNYLEFSRDVYPPFEKIFSRTIVERFQDRPAEDFDDGGPAAAIGKIALASVVVPPIALAFSLLGALIHIFKVLKYFLVVFLPKTFPAALASYGVVGVVLVFPFLNQNPVTASQGYRKLEANKSAEGLFGTAQSAAFRWVIQAQPYFYPASETFRLVALRDYKFNNFPSTESSYFHSAGGETKRTD